MNWGLIGKLFPVNRNRLISTSEKVTPFWNVGHLIVRIPCFKMLQVNSRSMYNKSSSFHVPYITETQLGKDSDVILSEIYLAPTSDQRKGVALITLLGSVIPEEYSEAATRMHSSGRT